MRNYALLTIVAIILSACASAGEDYPSLAVRDVERAQGTFEPAPAEPLQVPQIPVNYTGSLAERLDALVAQARGAHERFIEARPQTAALVAQAQGTGPGSNPWSAAQVALADLESIRSETAVALGDLDVLAVAASVQAEQRDGITNAREQVLELVAEEDAALKDLRGQIE